MSFSQQENPVWENKQKGEKIKLKQNVNESKQFSGLLRWNAQPNWNELKLNGQLYMHIIYIHNIIVGFNGIVNGRRLNLYPINLKPLQLNNTAVTVSEIE